MIVLGSRKASSFPNNSYDSNSGKSGAEIEYFLAMRIKTAAAQDYRQETSVEIRDIWPRL